MLQKETIKDFQETISKECGRSVSFEEAGEILGGWVKYFDLLAQIYHREKQNDENENNENN